jgi:molybdopterin molybdotransferase
MNPHDGSRLEALTPLDDALARLRGVVDPVERTERLPVTSAAGRVLAADVTARRAVPHYDCAARDGFAVRASATTDATARSPVRLRVGDGPVEPGEAVRVHSGSELPDCADAVVHVADTRLREGSDEVAVTTAVPAGANVVPTGEDVPGGGTVFAAGRRLQESDPGWCRAVGRNRVDVVARPTVGVVPTGDDLVETDPGTGDVVETSGLTTARFVERWGGKPTYRNPVPDDRHALRAAVERDLTKDIVVTTGGTSVGERDGVPEVVDELGDGLVHGVALEPGRSVGFGVVQDTPVLALPGSPVACLVTAMALLRPAVKRVGGLPLDPVPTRRGRLSGTVPSEVGVRTFTPVSVGGGDTGTDGNGDGDDEPVVEPVRESSTGVVSNVAATDGWVVVPESREGVPAGDTVPVRDWEHRP